MNDRILFFLFLFLPIAFSCTQTTTKTIESGIQNTVEEKVVELKSPLKEGVFVHGSALYFKAGLVNKGFSCDSFLFMVDCNCIGRIYNIEDSIVWNSSNAKLGGRSVEVVAYADSGKSFRDYYKIFLKLGQRPQLYSYKIVNIFPHDKKAYTQGLVFENGCFFEGTGLYKQSTLRKVKVETGVSEKSITLSDDVFGEGIALFDNKILQISYKEQVAFLYNKENFQLINKFYYPMKEGWGLTFNGTNLIMSDGTSNLYFMDKEYFTEIGRVEVFDENGPVFQLNELEYINGEIWANIYQTDTIVTINPNTGAVTRKIALSGLLKKADISNNTDVLNGIAYDSKRNRLFVTGKNWPKLFEITIHRIK